MLQRLAAGVWELARLDAGAAGALRAATVYQKQADGRWLTDAPLTATLSSSAGSIKGLAANQASGLIHAIAAGGVGDLSIAWAKRAAGGAIVADSPASFDTTFSAAGLAAGEVRTAQFDATISDELGAELVVGPVTLTFERFSTPVVDVPASASASGAGTPLSTAAVTALLTGGTAPFQVTVSKRAGGGAIVADNPSSLTTTFSAADLAQGETRNATFDFVVKDANGLQASDSIGVSISRLSALTVALSTTSLSSNVTTADATTAAVTASPTGGLGPYQHSWAHKSGDAIAADSPAAGTTKFSATGLVGGDAGESRSAVFVDTVTDSNGSTVDSAEVTVTIARAATSPTYTPAAGTYDKSASSSVSYTIAASQVVRWDWSGTPTTGLSADVATGGSSSSITFTLAAGSGADRSSTVTVTATGADGSAKQFTLNLAAIAPATYTPAGGSTSSSGNGAVSKTITASRAVTWDWTRTSGVGTCNVVTGGSSSSITFSLAGGADRSSVFTVTATDAAGVQTTWTVTLTSYVAATYNKAAGSYSDTDATSAGASYTLTASRAVTWNWTRTGATQGTSSPANHSSASAMTLSLPQGTTNRTCTFTVTATDAGGVSTTWTITLTSNASSATVTFTPAAGTYSASGDSSAQYTITASQAVVWTWSRTSGSAGSANVASGSSATSITFTLSGGLNGRTASFSVSANGKSWTINLDAAGSGGGTL